MAVPGIEQDQSLAAAWKGVVENSQLALDKVE
jgi:hypothetical protein